MVLAAVTALTCAPALAQSWAVPPESQRCPSKWGAGDERGSGNHMKPASVLRAAQLIKTGEVIEIAHVLNDKMPFFGTRRFDVHVKRLWGKDNARYVKSCPGIGIAAAEWLAKEDPMLIGSDNWPVEVAPNPDPKLSLPVHQVALVVNGLHLLENLKLDDLAAKQVYEFAFVMQPLKAQGFTGSTVAPVAIR